MFETSIKNKNKETYLKVSVKNNFINLFINNRFDKGDFIEEFPSQAMSFDLIENEKYVKDVFDVFDLIVTVRYDIFSFYLQNDNEYIKQILKDSVL